jgi:AAA domain
LLLPKFRSRIRDQVHALVIIDPTYKLLGTADENSATDISALLNMVESLAVSTGAAVAMAGHFAKGNASAKESIDRISGSGVFARDPDSLIIFTKHEQEGAFTVELTLRNLDEYGIPNGRFFELLKELQQAGNVQKSALGGKWEQFSGPRETPPATMMNKHRPTPAGQPAEPSRKQTQKNTKMNIAKNAESGAAAATPSPLETSPTWARRRPLKTHPLRQPPFRGSKSKSKSKIKSKKMSEGRNDGRGTLAITAFEAVPNGAHGNWTTSAHLN